MVVKAGERDLVPQRIGRQQKHHSARGKEKRKTATPAVGHAEKKGSQCGEMVGQKVDEAYTKAYKRLQNGSDVRGVALNCTSSLASF